MAQRPVKRARVEPADRFVGLFPDFRAGRIVDLGCGPADIPMRLCRALPEVHVTGVDGSAPMLELGRQAVAVEGLAARIELVRAILPDGPSHLAPFDAVVSNRLLHHLHDPGVMWRAVRQCAAPGAPIFVMDLFRVISPEAARAIVDEHAADEPEILREDFCHSLLAAFTVDEVHAQLDDTGLGALTVEGISGRHLGVWGRAPAP